jgi:RNA polymerase sigma factor (sigma-70 family)
MHPSGVNIVSLAVAQDELVRRAGSGDSEALAALYRAHEAGIYTLARRLCRGDAEAQDVLQETFLEAAKSLNRYRGDGPVAGWLKRICATKAWMRQRRERRYQEAEGDEPVAPLPLDARLDLEPALGRLPAPSRTVVWLHDVEGWTHAEIAAVMGQSESYSKSQLARAHARLRAWLKPDEGGA